MVKLKDLLFEFFDKDEFDFEFVSKENCEEFIKKHYIGKPPAAVQDYIGIFYKNRIVGCVIYGAPSSVSLADAINKNLPDNLKLTSRDISELKRLFISDGDFDKKGLASRSISVANNMIYNKRGIKLIVSYSNTSVHPNATVYRATNAIYNGKVRDKIRWIYVMGAPKFKKYMNRALSDNNK